jgi:hypothetical protein
MGRKSQHQFHGAPYRFEIIAEFVGAYFGSDIQYVADVAGGKGMLSKLLNKHYNYDAEVIDPRGNRIKGVPGRAEPFDPAMAGYYDLIVGLHPDQATRPIAEAARTRPALIIPCCNFWSADKLGRDELVAAIEADYQAHGLHFQRVIFPMQGPKHIGILSHPQQPICAERVVAILSDLRVMFGTAS